MLAGLGALSGTFQAGQGSAVGNAGPSATGDTILGPIDMSGPVVNFSGAGNAGAPTAPGAMFGGMNPLVLAGVAAGAVWFLSKRR
jgi:hypothetical protein